MQRLEVSCAVRPLYGSLGVKGLMILHLINEMPILLNNLTYDNMREKILMVLLLHQVSFRPRKGEECNRLGMQSACERS